MPSPRKIALRLGALSCLTSLVAAPMAFAQISGKSGPVMFGADHNEANAKDHTQTLDGRVEMLQDTARLRADHVKVFSAAPKGDANASGFGEIIRIEAEGNIYYTDTANNQIIKGDHGVYTKADDTMVITGDVILRQGDNVSTGNRLSYNETSGQMLFDANPVNGAKGRVTGVFYPDNSPQKPKPAPKP